jgi:hypothetical protein
MWNGVHAFSIILAHCVRGRTPAFINRRLSAKMARKKARTILTVRAFCCRLEGDAERALEGSRMAVHAGDHAKSTY